MKHSDFLTAIRKNRLYIFTVNDVARYFPETARKTIQNQVQLWAEKGRLERLRRGVYLVRFPEGGPVVPDFFIANKLYETSYVSMETALSFYSIIPEVAAAVTSVTARQTKLFKNKFGIFRYNSCKNEAFCGYKIMVYDGFKIYIAEKEKALADFVYFKKRSGEEIDLASERFDEVGLKKLSWKKIFYYAKFFGKKTRADLRKIRSRL